MAAAGVFHRRRSGPRGGVALTPARGDRSRTCRLSQRKPLHGSSSRVSTQGDKHLSENKPLINATPGAPSADTNGRVGNRTT